MQDNHKFWSFCLRAHETLATALVLALSDYLEKKIPKTQNLEK
jgi:hypothetical protein